MVHTDMVLTVQKQANPKRNEKKNGHQKIRVFVFFLAGLMLLSKTALSGEFDIRPEISVSQIAIQDEIGADILERDLITEAIPKVNVDLNTRRIRAQAEYAFEQRAYFHNADHFRMNQRYRLASAFEFIKDRGVVNVATSSAQRLENPLGGLSIDNNGYFSNNRSDYQTYSTGIKWNQPISSLANGSLNANLNQTVSESSLINNTQNQFVRAALSNGKWFQRSFWNLEAIQSRQSYSSNQTPYTRSALATTGLRITRQVNVSATGGYEQNPQIAFSQNRVTSGYVIEGKLSWILNKRFSLNSLYGHRSYGETYDFSFDWRPSERTALNGVYGKKVFGKTYNFLFSHQFRKADWHISYSEDLTSRSYVEIEKELRLLLDENGLPVISTTTGQPIITSDDVLFIRDGVYVKKTFSLGGKITGRKNSLTLNANCEKRVFQEQDVADDGYGANASWELDVGSRGELGALVNFQRGGYGGISRKDNIYQGQVSYSHVFAEILSTRMEFNYLMRDSSDVGADQKQYLLRAQLTAKF